MRAFMSSLEGKGKGDGMFTVLACSTPIGYFVMNVKFRYPLPCRFPDKTASIVWLAKRRNRS